MKISRISTMLLLLVVIASFGCSKEEDPSKPEFKNVLPKDFSSLEIKVVTTSWAIDAINDVFFKPGADNIAQISKSANTSKRAFEIKGWAVNESTKTAPSSVFFILTSKDGSKFYVQALRFDRPDIGKSFNNDNYINAGFAISAGSKNLPKGEYTASVIQFAGNTGYRAGNSSMMPVRIIIED